MPLRHDPIVMAITGPDGRFDEDLWRSCRATSLNGPETATLFGENKRIGYWELWQQKSRGEMPDAAPGADPRSRAYKPAIAGLVADQQQFVIRRARDFLRHPDNPRAGTSIAYDIVGGDARIAEQGPGILVVKWVNRYVFDREWRTPEGGVRPPASVVVALHHDYYVSGRTWGGIGVDNGADVFWLDVRRDEDLVGEIDTRTRHFWSTVDAGEEPIPDFRAEAASILARYKSTTVGTKVVDPGTLTKIDDVARRLTQLQLEREQVAPRLNAIEREIKGANAELAKLMGDAERAVGSFTIFSESGVRAGFTVQPTKTRKFFVERTAALNVAA